MFNKSIENAVRRLVTVAGLSALTLLGTAALNACNSLGSKQSSADVESKIKAELSTDEKLRAANLDVKVDVDRNEAILKGTVPSEDLKAKAMEMAKHSGMTVTSNLEVDSMCCGGHAAHMHGHDTPDGEHMQGSDGMPGNGPR